MTIHSIKKVLLSLAMAVALTACDVSPSTDSVEAISGFSLAEALLVEKEYRGARFGSEGQRVLVYQLKTILHDGAKSCGAVGYVRVGTRGVLKNYPVIAPHIHPDKPICVRHGDFAHSGIAVLQGDKLIVIMIV